jgi:hypothetical protein
LAQTRTTANVFAGFRSVPLVRGKGTDLTNKQTIERRGKCKFITQAIIRKLIDVAKDKEGAEKRVKAYWRTYWCQSHLFESGGRLYGTYCKNRFCTLCCGIRRAEIIHKYLPVIKSWSAPHLVTLTIRAVRRINLHKFMRGMFQAFRRIVAKYRKRSGRGKGIKLMGIKALECCFNPVKKWYTPHLHIIVPDEAIATILIKEWLTIWTPEWAGPKPQHKRKVLNTEKDMIEALKYSSKIFTDPEGKGKRQKNKGVKPHIYIAAMDNIYAAMQGLRIFERFGFSLPKGRKREKEPSRVIEEAQPWEYDFGSRDWLNAEHESTLTAYIPSFELEALLEHTMDTHLE